MRTDRITGTRKGSRFRKEESGEEQYADELLLKSSDRTVEVPVMGMEGWSQVESLELGIIQSNHKDSSKTNRVTFLIGR